MMTRSSFSMPRFYLHACLSFLALRLLSILLHYLGPSPWGGPLVLSPDRFLLEAVVIELGIWGFVCGLFGLLEGLVCRLVPRAAYRGVFAGFLTTLAIFSQIDFEVVRWLGQHMSASYIANFAGARDGQLFSRILKGDKLFSSLAAVQMVLACALAVGLFVRRRRDDAMLLRKHLLILVAIVPAALLAPHWLRPSEKRWRRIEPAALGITVDLLASWANPSSPENPERALRDLVDLVTHGAYDKGAKPPDPRYPLWRDDNVGALAPKQFSALAPEEKPDVVLIVFETMRGFNTGLMGPPDGPLTGMPELRSIISESALYFPRMHSAGYPSVAGAMGMHLGVWPHHTKIVFSSYLHIETRSFVEMLREGGYQTHALLGADPSFSNFTPWFRRWYDEVEYKKENHHDGPLVDRFLELYRARVDRPAPQLFTLWTATTHPPYDVPPESGVKPAATNEERYLQAMRYADSHLSSLIRELQKSPRWDRTLVFILGDHAQPTPWQWTHTDLLGEISPGHTWTSLAILGGARSAPAPRRDERVISHVDLPPTILSLVNLRTHNHFFGRDVSRGTDERAVWAFLYGAMSRETKDSRTIFRIDDDGSVSYGFSREDVLSYGGLEGGSRIPSTSDPSLLARHRDVARAWAELLDDNRVAPPAP